MSVKKIAPYTRFATSVRGKLSARKINREKNKYAAFRALSIGETSGLQILPMFEAVSDNELRCGYGVSYLIRTDHSTILFDLGNNPDNESPSPLEKNMEQLGISLKELDCIVFSHRHPDHVGGMKWWSRRSFSLNGEVQHDLGKLPVFTPEKILYPHLQPQVLKNPTILAPGIATTGSFTFFESYPQGYFSPRDSEQSLAIQVKDKGIYLIVGCGHMGLITLLDRVSTLFGQPVAGVIGGLHYGKMKKENLQAEIKALQQINPQLLAFSPHDSYPEALKVFEEAFPEVYQPIRVGKVIHLHHSPDAP